MQLTDLNRERSIGANCMLVEIGPFRILIDAGLHPKRVGNEATPNYDLLDAGSLDLILITHCHLDHIGSLPVALRNHPEATVLTSVPSVSLIPRMLRNSCNVMKKQKAELNIPEYPLYAFNEIETLEDRLLPIQFQQPKTFHAHNESIEVTFHPSGHVVGAAGIQLTYKHQKIFFTGDVLFDNQRILPGAHFPEETFDTVVLETTRGRTERLPENARENELERLFETINHTLANGGSVLLPSFALGRMQEMLALLHDRMQARTLPRCNIFCTGLGMDLVNYFDMIARKTELVNFRSHLLKKIGVKTLKMKLTPGNDVPQPGIYVLSSGMLVEHTPSYHVAASMLGNKKNAVCFVGYCDPDTPGGQLLASKQDDTYLFETLDYEATIRARIEKFDLSGHADRDQLLDFTLAAQPRSIVLTHGDPEARDWFHQAITEQAPKVKIVDPIPGETYEV